MPPFLRSLAYLSVALLLTSLFVPAFPVRGAAISRGATRSHCAAIRSRRSAASTALVALWFGGYTPDDTAQISVNDVCCALSSGADVNASDAQGHTALMGAAYGGNVACLKYLIAKGAKVNAQDCRGNSPLWWASYAGNENCIEYLISAGAVINTEAGQGCPLEVTAQYGYLESVKYLVSKGAVDLDGALSAAAGAGQLDTMKYLVSVGAHPNGAPDRDHATPLASAAGAGETDCVAYLISRGADVNAPGQDDGSTALMCAAGNAGCGDDPDADYAVCIRLLIAKGARINARCKDGKNALEVSGVGKIQSILETAEALQGTVR